jgi:hypothetical protein
MMEIQSIKVILITLVKMKEPLTGVLLIQFNAMYLFATIGMCLFQGYITPNNEKIQADSSIPDKYWLMNFNCLMSSFVTLFCLMVVNNW